MVDPNNGYSQLRLGNYGLGDEGWDALPIRNPRVRPVTTQHLLGEGQGDFAALDLPLVDLSREELIDLGRRAFDSFPLGERLELQVGIEDSAAPSEFGLWVDDRQRVGGLLELEGEGGRTTLAPTCATCHGRLGEGGQLLLGSTNTDLRLDEMTSAAFRQPSADWGPGRVDPTGDGVRNPTVITDLRPIQHQSYLNWAASIRNSLLALAVRIETLYITSYGQRARPPREVALAIATYLYSLGDAGDVGDEVTYPEGAALFASKCSACHGSDGTTQGAIPFEAVGTDPRVAQSSMRGTGNYRIPTLWGVHDRSRLMHDGTLTSLEQMFDPTRLDAASPGSVPGHVFGLDLSSGEREQLLAFVRTIGD